MRRALRALGAWRGRQSRARSASIGLSWQTPKQAHKGITPAWAAADVTPPCTIQAAAQAGFIQHEAISMTDDLKGRTRLVLKLNFCVKSGKLPPQKRPNDIERPSQKCSRVRAAGHGLSRRRQLQWLSTVKYVARRSSLRRRPLWVVQSLLKRGQERAKRGCKVRQHAARKEAQHRGAQNPYKTRLKRRWCQ